ncbi:hypothetical protein SAMD00079811_50280 [Scytonema sp. HK-05]|uniref:NAD(P)/FAD-dependent oxidoreductase n=1 Tax=Scytonema sp. HK-05 TaxID=1137095 RepID=UPI000937065F|nr:tryptophan 7-halogenase [Scytonema sp. HK-05]OKH58026.1 tryptophan halogenase [Scytonema sp. HK-05]BAY47410.1 hypothetical protein SAMD00079811_50280 [Scytonema sp. HK-05]
MHTTQQLEYDVVIMGAGFVGVCQARHLLLKIPNIRIALIDPRPEERTEKDLKLGESMVEIATLFVSKELGLHEYLVENHPPKSGLNFHWAKDPAKTETTDDHYHVWSNRRSPIQTFQMNRAKFERDLLRMNKQMGAVFYHGRVVDVDLTPGDALKTVKVKLSNEDIELKAKHVIDGSGRKFIIGHKTDNLLFGPENLFGVNTGSAWVRVKYVDRTIFHDGYDPFGATCSHYYATNHWFGCGHWLWMIPTDKDTQEISIGIVQHHDVIPASEINTQEKFYAFLKANHTNLYKLLTSGENVDFHYLPRLAHSSKVMFSPDNWYVLGDAACIFDAFYSLGTTMISFEIESVTEIIRAKLAGEPDAEEKRALYNSFNLAYTRTVNHAMKNHSKHLGHASIMSWRIYFEYMWFFGLILPMYVGKWFLDPKYIRAYLKNAGVGKRVISDVYEQFSKLVDRGANIGLMDAYRADQLLGHYSTIKHFGNYLENAKLEPKRHNIFTSLTYAYFYLAIWYIMFQWKGFGLKGVLAVRNLYNLFSLLSSSAKFSLSALSYWLKTRGVPTNTQVAKMHQEFKSYQYRRELQPWIEDITPLGVQTQGSTKQQSNTTNVPRLPELSVSG